MRESQKVCSVDRKTSACRKNGYKITNSLLFSPIHFTNITLERHGPNNIQSSYLGAAHQSFPPLSASQLPITAFAVSHHSRQTTLQTTIVVLNRQTSFTNYMNNYEMPSATAPAPCSASDFSSITVATAKCDMCNGRDKATMKRCRTCKFQVCGHCAGNLPGGGNHQPSLY